MEFSFPIRAKWNLTNGLWKIPELKFCLSSYRPALLNNAAFLNKNIIHNETS